MFDDINGLKNLYKVSVKTILLKKEYPNFQMPDQSRQRMVSQYP